MPKKNSYKRRQGIIKDHTTECIIPCIDNRQKSGMKMHVDRMLSNCFQDLYTIRKRKCYEIHSSIYLLQLQASEMALIKYEPVTDFCKTIEATSKY